MSQRNELPAGEIIWNDANGRRHYAWFFNTTDTFALSQGLPFEVEFIGSEVIRYANVLKTVVHVAVDEADDGSAVIEKWSCKVNKFTH